jgi:hypothetical protein
MQWHPGCCGFAVDAAGYLYVVGAPERRVYKLDRDGRIVARTLLRVTERSWHFLTNQVFSDREVVAPGP